MRAYKTHEQTHKLLFSMLNNRSSFSLLCPLKLTVTDEYFS